MDIATITQCIGAVFEPMLFTIEIFFGSLMDDRFIIFGLPWYQWAIGFFVVTAIYKVVLGDVIDD